MCYYIPKEGGKEAESSHVSLISLCFYRVESYQFSEKLKNRQHSTMVHAPVLYHSKCASAESVKDL